MCVCCCCVSDRICIWALIGMNLALVIGLRVLSVETSARVFSPVGLNPMSHNAGLMCLGQLSPITSCDQFCGSRIARVTSQDFNTSFYGPWTVFVVKVYWLAIAS